MDDFEYVAVPAPSHGTKAKGVKSTSDRFALSMTQTLNAYAAEGWEYVRAETLPCDERKGITGTQTTYQNVLIFRRLIPTDYVSEELAAPLPPLTLEQSELAPEPAEPVLEVRPDPPVTRPTEQDA